MSRTCLRRSSGNWMPMKGLAENVSYLDCLWCELYGSSNSAQWSGEISEAQAHYLREKYLF